MESMDDTDRTRRQRGPVAYDFAPKRLSRSRPLTNASEPSQQTPLNTPEMEFECEGRQAQPMPGQDSAVPTRHKRPSRMNTPVSCWCKCGKCHSMPYEVEHICCQELHFPRKELEGQSCITLDEEFDKICLTRAVLEVAVVMQRSVQGLHNAADMPNKSLRYTAYRTFIAWTHGYLGKGNRRPVPSCAAWLIRNNFPEEEGFFTGFRDSLRSEIQEALQS